MLFDWAIRAKTPASMDVRGELGNLLDFVSPSFFRVMPARALWSTMRTLASSARDADVIGACRLDIQAVLTRMGLPFVLYDKVPTGTRGPCRGADVVALYFAQLMHTNHALLDLRGARFSVTPEHIGWAPRPLLAKWQPDFIEPLRRLYTAFFAGDDGPFRQAANDLNLAPAVDVMLAHFGSSEHTPVTFELRKFRQSFHDIFVRCRDANISLHPDFTYLGIYLATMYEHLDSGREPIAVRDAFVRVQA